MSYTPLFPFKDDQFIFNSNRISLNAKTDSIFLFASKAISLSSNESIHLNTNEDILLNSKKIYLGLNASEPLIKGNELYNLLSRFFKDTENIGDILSSAVDSNNNAIPNVQAAGNSLRKSSMRMQTLMKNIRSEFNFTI